TNKEPIFIQDNNPPASTAGIYTAITGRTPLLNSGNIVANPAICFEADPGDPNSAQPRSAAGVSDDGRYLILLTIDGRQPGYSDGACDVETAEWLLRFGAYHGISLD